MKLKITKIKESIIERHVVITVDIDNNGIIIRKQYHIPRELIGINKIEYLTKMIKEDHNPIQGITKFEVNI